MTFERYIAPGGRGRGHGWGWGWRRGESESSSYTHSILFCTYTSLFKLLRVKD